MCGSIGSRRSSGRYWLRSLDVQVRASVKVGSGVRVRKRKQKRPELCLGWLADEGAVMTVREGLKEGAKGCSLAAPSREAGGRAVSETHRPQKKGECGTGAGGAASWQRLTVCWAAGLAEVAPELGRRSRDAKEAPNTGNEALKPGRVGSPGNPGGASRKASAGRGHAHERHVGVEEPAPRGLLSAAPRRPAAGAGGTAGGVPAGRRRCREPRSAPAGRRGAGPHRGLAPGGALHARLLPGAWASSPLGSGKPGSFVLGWRGV